MTTLHIAAGRPARSDWSAAPGWPPADSTPSRGPHHVQDLRSHHRLRGPYTAGGQLLRQIVPELRRVDPDLITAFSTAITAIAPDLEGDLRLRPPALTDLVQKTGWTRCYAVERTRDLAFLASELVRVWARVCHPDGVTLNFWELQDADPTDVLLVSTLHRRCDRTTLEIVDAGPRTWQSLSERNPDPAQRYLDADGTSTDPSERAAYERLTEAERKARHSRRGRLLVERAEPGTHLGSIPYHLERGEDPTEATPWLVAGQNQTFGEGFYEAALDLGRRARGLVRFVTDPQTHTYLTQRVIAALIQLSRRDEALALLDEPQPTTTTTEVAEQINDACLLAMIYSQPPEPTWIDRGLPLAWVGTALAPGEDATLPVRKAHFAAFIRNARALVELHRGNLVRSLTLVNEAITLVDEHLLTAPHHRHRTALIHNRARVSLGLQDYDGAVQAFSQVLSQDPESDEPYLGRALAEKARGDFDAALRDLDRALDLNPAFTDAFYHRADLRLDRGEDESALADLSTVLDIDPDHVQARLLRAALLLGTGDLEAAEADLANGLTVNPTRAHLWSAKGLLHSELGAEQTALECFSTALCLDPGLVEVYANRAVLHFLAGRPEASVADLDRALELRDCGPWRVNRAIARHDLGDAAGAVRDFDAALASPEVDVADLDELRARRELSRQLVEKGGAPDGHRPR